MRLDAQNFALKDYHKAKRLFWNPQDLDLRQDREDFRAMTADEQRLVRIALALFIGGEASVTHDLAPLLIAIKHGDDRLEEALFVATQIFEEAKHVEFFAAVLAAIELQEVDPLSVAGDSYRALFDALDKALNALLADTSARALAEAVVTYHMVVEGVLAETGYYAIFEALRRRGLMPGLTKGLELVQRDEARHVAFGLYLLTDLIESDKALWSIIDARLNALLPLAQGVFMDLFVGFSPDLPFGLDLNDVLMYAARQYMARQSVLERARSGPVGDPEL